MLTTLELLEPLAARRTDEIVVTTMSTVRPWGLLSDHDLDFASADSAMGHAVDLALGIALAPPNRLVVCFNGDGSMLMTLGTLALFVPGAVWLSFFVTPARALHAGVLPFLPGAVIKIGLAAALLPLGWRALAWARPGHDR